MITNGEIIRVNVVAVCETLNNSSQNAMLSESRKRTLAIRRNIQKFCESARTRVRSFDVENWRQELLELFFFYNCYFQIWICKLLFDIEWCLTRELVSIWGIYKKKFTPAEKEVDVFLQFDD